MHFKQLSLQVTRYNGTMLQWYKRINQCWWPVVTFGLCSHYIIIVQLRYNVNIPLGLHSTNMVPTQCTLFMYIVQPDNQIIFQASDLIKAIHFSKRQGGEPGEG